MAVSEEGDKDGDKGKGSEGFRVAGRKSLQTLVNVYRREGTVPHNSIFYQYPWPSYFHANI
jgi:hypothetical protein